MHSPPSVVQLVWIVAASGDGAGCVPGVGCALPASEATVASREASGTRPLSLRASSPAASGSPETAPASLASVDGPSVASDSDATA